MTPADLPPLPEPAHEQRVEYEGIARNGIEITPLFDRKQMHAYGKLCARQALERAAISAWSTGMDEHNKAAGLPCDARTTGSRCAAAIRAIAEEYK